MKRSLFSGWIWKPKTCSVKNCTDTHSAQWGSNIQRFSVEGDFNCHLCGWFVHVSSLQLFGLFSAVLLFLFRLIMKVIRPRQSPIPSSSLSPFTGLWEPSVGSHPAVCAGFSWRPAESVSHVPSTVGSGLAVGSPPREEVRREWWTLTQVPFWASHYSP